MVTIRDIIKNDYILHIGKTKEHQVTVIAHELLDKINLYIRIDNTIKKWKVLDKKTVDVILKNDVNEENSVIEYMSMDHGGLVTDTFLIDDAIGLHKVIHKSTELFQVDTFFSAIHRIPDYFCIEFRDNVLYKPDYKINNIEIINSHGLFNTDGGIEVTYTLMYRGISIKLSEITRVIESESRKPYYDLNGYYTYI